MTNFLKSNMAAIPSVNSHSVPLPYTVWSQSDGIVIVVVMFNIIDFYSLVIQLSHTHTHRFCLPLLVTKNWFVKAKLQSSI